MNLNTKDYNSILEFYKINLKDMTNNQKKIQAENILSTKLCRCIKSVKKKNKTEKEAIGICKASVIEKKGLAISGFKCKNGPKLINKKSKQKLKKIKKSKTKRRLS